VVVTGMGCISPLGNNLAATWESAIAGKSGVAPITMFDASDLKTRFAAEVKGFDPQEALGRREARRMDRYTQLAAVAVQQAVEHAGLTINDANRDRIGVVLGTGMGGAGTLVSETRKFVERGPRWVSPHLVPMMLPDASPGQIAIMLGARGPNMSVVTACASGTNAIGEASEMIQRGHRRHAGRRIGSRHRRCGGGRLQRDGCAVIAQRRPAGTPARSTKGGMDLYRRRGAFLVLESEARAGPGAPARWRRSSATARPTTPFTCRRRRRTAPVRRPACNWP
jgi:hypothetical protein